MLKPGAELKAIWEAQNAWRRKIGRPEEARLRCHGQGYDLVERPLVKFDEPWTIHEEFINGRNVGFANTINESETNMRQGTCMLAWDGLHPIAFSLLRFTEAGKPYSFILKKKLLRTQHAVQTLAAKML